MAGEDGHDSELLELEDPVSAEPFVADPASEHHPLLLECGHTLSRYTVRQVCSSLTHLVQKGASTPAETSHAHTVILVPPCLFPVLASMDVLLGIAAAGPSWSWHQDPGHAPVRLQPLRRPADHTAPVAAPAHKQAVSP